MQPEELDIALEELETRLERLRALYEQYFLGIEKIEPAVARKDVDRRIWMLRRVQIRNTARRFKLQTLIQRYNTFQQYWARICREIENGTYTRHLLKAQKKVGAEALTWAARKRLGRVHPDLGNAEASDASSASAEAAEDTDHAESSLGVDWDPLAAALSAATIGAPPEHGIVAAAASEAQPARKAPVEPLDLDLDAADDEPPPRRKPALPLPKAKLPLPGITRPVTANPAPAAHPAAPARASPVLAAPAPASPVTPASAEPAMRPDAAVPRAARAPDKSADNGFLSEQRIKELHAELVAVKRQLNQTSNVSVDGLAKSLRATANKLRDQTKGRNVDFEIVVKDGQAVVRPIVRKSGA